MSFEDHLNGTSEIIESSTSAIEELFSLALVLVEQGHHEAAGRIAEMAKTIEMQCYDVLRERILKSRSS